MVAEVVLGVAIEVKAVVVATVVVVVATSYRRWWRFFARYSDGF